MLFYQPRNRQGEPFPPLRERLSSFRHVPPFIRLVWQVHPLYLTGIALLRMTSGLVPVLMLWVGKLIVDAVVDGVTSGVPDWPYLTRLILLELGIAVSAEALARTSTLLESLLGDLVGQDVSLKVMRHATSLDLEHLEDPDVLNRLQRARQQTSGQVAFISQLLSMGQASLTLASMLVALVAFDALLVGILIAAILPSFFGETAYASITYSFMFQWTAQRRKLDYLSWVASEVEPAKELRLFGLGDHFVDRYARLSSAYLAENRRLASYRTATGLVLNTTAILAYYAAIAVIVYQTVEGSITIGDLTFLTGSFRQSRALVSSLLQDVALSHEKGLQLKDLFDFLRIEPRIANGAAALPIPDQIQHGFSLENVSFRYPGSDRWALRDVSLTIGPTDSIALVGENGAGKTTIIKLLSRLYEPTQGRVLLDGVDLRRYELDGVRRCFGIIFQDFFRYDLTLRENVGVGDVEHIQDLGRVADACRRSLATDVVDRLEAGYDQLLGRRFADGENLSGGEWQKIALARAYMREAECWILDEPTASLDARAEQRAFERFASMAQGRMSVLISHRFPTIRIADRILVMEEGRVVERGTHESLLALEGRYAEMFNLQAHGYQ